MAQEPLVKDFSHTFDAVTQAVDNTADHIRNVVDNVIGTPVSHPGQPTMEASRMAKIMADARANAASAAGGGYTGGLVSSQMSPGAQVVLANKYGAMYGVDPKILLAIAKHETGFGTLGAGRQGYTLGYGATDSGQLSQYAGVENQYMWAARTLAQRGVHNLSELLANPNVYGASDPNWASGVAAAYRSL